jgi:hypothetical protein
MGFRTFVEELSVRSVEQTPANPVLCNLHIKIVIVSHKFSRRLAYQIITIVVGK